MSDSKPLDSSQTGSRNKLFSTRTLMIFLLVASFSTAMLLWRWGVGIGEGQAAAGVLVVLLVAASLGEVMRGRFRLSLKAWLIAFTACSVMLGFFAQHLVRVARQRQSVQRVLSLGRWGAVSYDYQEDGGDWFITQRGIMLPSWLKNVFSNDLFGRVNGVHLPLACKDQDLPIIFSGITEIDQLQLADCRGITDDGLEHLSQLTTLRSVYLNGNQATATGLRHLSQLPRLEMLQLWYQQVTDKTLTELSSLRHVRQLSLYKTNVSDEGMQHVSKLSRLRTLGLGGAALGDGAIVHLRHLRKLQSLSLAGTNVSDQSIGYLQEITTLRHLSIGGTSISEEGIRRLHQVLPRCEIRY